MKKRYLVHRPKKVALVCMGPSATDYLGKTLTQEYDHRWVDEVWCINMGANPFRCDVVFWMDDLIDQEQFRPNLFVALRKFNVPVITSVARRKVVPKSYDYPIAEVSRLSIPVFGKPYLNNGVAMAIGYALWKGVEQLHIYGADFSYPNRDYAESGRACVESWLTLASLRGLDIHLCPNTSLMDSVKDHGIYGYKDQPAVTMPDGKVFQYRRLSETMGKYLPEDSSGVKNDKVRVRAAGVGGPTSHNGRGAAGPVKAARLAAAAASRSSKGVRRRAAATPEQGQPHEGGGLAVHELGRGTGRVLGHPRVEVPPPPRPVDARLKNGRGPESGSV